MSLWIIIMLIIVAFVVGQMALLLKAARHDKKYPFQKKPSEQKTEKHKQKTDPDKQDEDDDWHDSW